MKVRAVLPVLTSACLAAPSHAGDGHLRVHSWAMEHGNLVPNWSFENALDTWFQEGPDGGMSASTRHAPSGFAARSGAFTGRITGTTGTSSAINLLRTGKFAVVSGQPYTLSFHVRSSGAVSPDCFPAVFLYPDNLGHDSYIPGPSYATFSGSSTLSQWTLYVLQFTPPSSTKHVHIGLWRSASTGVAADLFFDDVVVEEGALNSTQVAHRRARHGYSVAFSDALGKTHQTHARTPDASTEYLVQATLFDSAGRPVKTPLPFPRTSSPPSFATSPLASANDYYDGSAAPDADGYAFAEASYVPEPSSRVRESAAPGYPWRLGGGRTVRGGFYFISSLTPPSPGEILSPSPDPHEREMRLDWSMDEDSVIGLTWTNRRGQVVQTARQTKPAPAEAGGGWAITRMEYYPAGGLRRVLTPLDVEAGDSAFAEVMNYNAQGLLTSRYTQDRGLERFWYNKRGMLRYAQDERQREQGYLYTYRDYDALGNLVSTGEQNLYYPDPETVVDGDGYGDPHDKGESRGWLYGTYAGFEARTGVPLDSVLPPSLRDGSTRVNALRAAWHRNNASPAPGFTDAERLVADFYDYDSLGRLARSRKYLGAMERGRRLQGAEYQRDALGRLTRATAWRDGSPDSALAEQGTSYDPWGRVSVISGLESAPLAGYTYAPHGPLSTVRLALDGQDGTVMHYGYHIRGWTQDVSAVRDANGYETWRQSLGYEGRALDESGVPALTKARYTGQIAQQLYKFTAEVPEPVRAVNYTYDMQGRMVAADYREGSGLNTNQTLQFPLSLSDADDLDARVAYDANGRILGKRSGGVSSEDSARYVYYSDGSYRVGSVWGKLSSGPRDASLYGNFQYDAVGNMTRDLSKNLKVSYGHDGMPVALEARGWPAYKGNGEMMLYPLYDASGRRVSQVMVPRLASGFPVYWVGHAEGDEDPGMYTADGVENALTDANYRMNFEGYPAPDSLVLLMVLDEGETELVPGFSEVTALSKGDTAVPVVLHGVRKYGAAYDSLMARRVGRRAYARHEVDMGGWVAGEVREVYGAGDTVTARAVTGL